MLCPRCHSEYRSGFTRCADCNVDLVDALPADPPAAAASRSSPRIVPSPALVDFCGFFTLDEAREARERLRGQGIGCEIAIREGPGDPPAAAPQEEYWLRFRSCDLATASALLGVADASVDGVEEAACGTCGAAVASAETFCPHCGARFEGSS